MLAVSKQISATIEEKLDSGENILYALANNPMMTDPAVTEPERVAYYQKKAEELDYNLFFYCDKTGLGINLTENGETFELAETEYFQQAIAGNKFTTPVIIDQLDGKKIVINSVPYYDAAGQIIGVFCGIRNANFLTEICQSVEWLTLSLANLKTGDFHAEKMRLVLYSRL